MIEFEDKLDKDRVLWDNSRNFDKNFILLQEYDGKQQVCNLSLTKTSFWVRIHNLPLMAHDQEIGELVGNSIEKSEEVDLEVEEVEWGEFMSLC